MPPLLGPPGNTGATPLMYAALARNTEVIKLLIEKGADVNARDNGASAALILAAAMGDPATVKLLLEKGAEVSVRNERGYTALMCAAALVFTLTVSLLVAEQASQTSGRRNDQGAVRKAIEKSLPLLESIRVPFIEKTGCVSCHHNSLPAMAAALARERGFKLNERVTTVEAPIQIHAKEQNNIEEAFSERTHDAVVDRCLRRRSGA